MCSGCGVIKEDLNLTNLTDVCERCGTNEDCDLDAAENVNTGGKAYSEPTNACGHDGSVPEHE